LRELVEELNSVALSIVKKDGEHAAMFFVRLPSGDLKVTVFDDAERPVGEARARQMAEAVRRTDADAVVFVSEAWTADPTTIPQGGRAGDAPDPDDVLLVAGVDRSGAEFSLATQLHKRDGAVDVGQAEEGSRVFLFDDVRAAWGLGPSH
jgi:hypothetical protein